MMFSSPDTLIPDPSNPLDWNRYLYARANPVNFNDPSGHSPETPKLTDGGGLLIVLALVALVIIAVYADRETDRPNKVSEINAGKNGGGTLAESFDNQQVKKFTDHQQIDQLEFAGMMDAVYSDLSDPFIGPIVRFDPARMSYDTPFFTGNPQNHPNKYPDHTVCIGNKCSPQSAVNYVAQGQWAAAAGENIDDLYWDVNQWNWLINKNGGTDDERYWAKYGYDYYMEKEKNEDD